jgi:hypothetical protein
LVGVAYGAARKITSFTTFGEPAGAEGMAILNYVSGTNETVVQIIVTGFSAGTTYDIEFVGVGFIEVAFTTDNQGNGHFHRRVSGDISAVSAVKLMVGVVVRATGS